MESGKYEIPLLQLVWLVFISPENFTLGSFHLDCLLPKESSRSEHIF